MTTYIKHTHGGTRLGAQCDPQRREFSVKCSRLKCVYLVLLMSLTAFISIENAHDVRGTSDSAGGGFYKETLEYAHNPQVDYRHSRCLGSVVSGIDVNLQ